MTTAVKPAESSTRVASVVLLGADAVLAARPATAVQLAHACLRTGYSSVVPPSWGDELLASEALRSLSQRAPGPLVHCACPRVIERLLDVGDDLAPFLLALVPPPIAAARYVRALAGSRAVRITYVGACPAGADPEIDVQVAPDAFLAMLAERGILLSEQPMVFEDVLPPDRRRHRSLPGGVPTAEMLWQVDRGWPLIEIDGEEPLTDLAQHLASGERMLIDLAPALGCNCSGATVDMPPRAARGAVMSLEPPRSGSDTVDVAVPVQLTREPLAPLRQPPAHPVRVPTYAEPAPSRPDAEHETASQSAPRPVGRGRTVIRGTRPRRGAAPAGGAGEGRSLPRAYIARRAATRKPSAGASASVSRQAPPLVQESPSPARQAAARRPGAHNGAEPDRELGAQPDEGATEERAVVRDQPRHRLFAAVPIAVATPAEREAPHRIDEPAVPSQPAEEGRPPTEERRQPTATPSTGEAAEESRASREQEPRGAVLSEMRGTLVNIVGMLGASLGTLADLLLDPPGAVTAERKSGRAPEGPGEESRDIRPDA